LIEAALNISFYKECSSEEQQKSKRHTVSPEKI